VHSDGSIVYMHNSLECVCDEGKMKNVYVFDQYEHCCYKTPINHSNSSKDCV
jgi:hypothetical protein